MGCIMRGWTSGNYVPPAESVKKPAQIVQTRKSSKKHVSWFDGYGKDERESQDAMDVDGDEEVQAVSKETDKDALGADVLIRGWDSDLTESDEDDPNLLDFMLANGADLSADCNAALSSGYSSISCTIKHCRNFLPLNYTWKCCPTCRKHRREYQRKRLGCDIKKDKYQGDQSTSVSSSGSASIPLKVHSSFHVQNYPLIAYIFRRFAQKTNWDHTPYTIPQVSSLPEPEYAQSAAASTSFPTKLSTSSSCASLVGFAVLGVPGFGKQERKS